MRFWNKRSDGDLEARLRASRPEAPSELVRMLSAQIAPRRARRPALAFAAVFTVLLVTAFAAAGGVSYAADAVSSTVSTATSKLTSSTTTNTTNGGSGGCYSSCDQYSKKGKIILKKKTTTSDYSTYFKFTGALSGSIKSGGSLSDEVAAPGTYTAKELATSGWTLVSISCDDSDSTGSGSTATYKVSPNETVTCTFTNKKADVIKVDCNCLNSSKKAFSGTIASFTDTNKSLAKGTYHATIDWGDGTSPTTGTVSGSNGNFDVDGSHTYSKTGTYTVKVTVKNDDGRSDDTTCTLKITY
jgi:uncharacterized cupredoxin-like copper-binding protein